MFVLAFFKCLFWPCSLPRLPISRVIGCGKTLQHVLEPPFNLNVLHQNKHLSHLLIYNFSKSRFQCDALTLGSALLFRRSRKGSFCELEGLGTSGRLNICSDRQFQTILPFWSYSGGIFQKLNSHGIIVMANKRCRFICKQTHILDFENTPINICSPFSLFEVVVHPLVACSNIFLLMFFPIVYCLALPPTL